jgi:4'-phosphopantetheinyl transferase
MNTSICQVFQTSRLACTPEETHIWRIVLDPSPAELNALDAVLSEEEHQRASRFATKRLRERWTVARGALRVILAAYVGTPPFRLVLSSDTNGRPLLGGLDTPIFFNVTHTAHLAFVAVAVEGMVGIDAEVLRPDIDWAAVSRRLFTRAECHEIASLAPETRIRAFYACWTRKEAFLKALGVGLYAALNDFRVTVHPDQPPSLVWVKGMPIEPQHWILRDLSESGVAIALAARKRRQAVRRFAFQYHDSDADRGVRDIKEGAMPRRRQ